MLVCSNQLNLQSNCLYLILRCETRMGSCTIFGLACALAATVVAATSDLNPFSDAFIDFINSQDTTWKAGRNFPLDTPLLNIINMLGVHPDANVDSLPNHKHNAELIAILPDQFDSRDEWPNCASINEIRDQGGCGSCWAVGAVEAMTDRVCIGSGGTQLFHFSAEDLLSCCTKCGEGCNGGWPSYAWEYWQSHGIVSGGNYDSKQGCRPYSIAPCDHMKRSTFGDELLPCTEHQTPDCSNVCETGYNVDYQNDKWFAKSVYAIKDGEDEIKAELYQNGPVEASFAVFEDFLQYKSGVYRHIIKGKELGRHAIKIIGWGVENGTNYWLIANSWNESFGENGFFKILRGEDHCGIESHVVAGMPAFK